MTGEQGELLDEITRRLVAELDPDAIYLFGSYAWGTPDEESDVDLMVVVPEADAAERFRLATRGRGALRGLGIAKDVRFGAAGVLRSGACGGARWSTASGRRDVSSMPGADLAREWLVQSDRDLRGARQLLSAPDPLYDLAAFLAQQAAETAMKGFLAAHGIGLEKTHDISRLIELAAPIDASFETFAEVADVLTAYVALTRYPDEGPYVPSREDAMEAIAAAGRIAALVRDILRID
ncbi:MAG: HEPN domain-containing protein [Dehalococcoidia bacterium]|nr:HEPN domain-containing protein [Dehalococcoidia bacterium]